MSYGQQRVIAIAVAVALGMIGAVTLADTAVSGLTKTMVFWLTVVSTGLGILAGFLPRVTGSDQQPEHIANRIMELSPKERAALLEEVESRRVTQHLETGTEIRIGPKPPEPMDRPMNTDMRFP